MTADRVLRIGVLGLGAAGAGMIPAIVAHPRTVLAGAADLDPALRERVARDFAIAVDDTAEALLRRADIDAVYIATPHQFHRDHAILAAESGKHAIVEKPMALLLADCDAMIAAARRAGTILLVGHTHSFDAPILLMRDLIRGDTVGRVAMVALWNYTDFLYRPRRPEELDTARGGGILFNQIPHQVDIARFLIDAPVRSVRAVSGILDPARPTEGSCMALLDFEGGAAASLVYSGYDRFDSDELHGWIGERGQPKAPRHGATYRALQAMGGPDEERRARRTFFAYGEQGRQAPRAEDMHQPHFGELVVTCERADLRLSADGILVYDGDGVREVRVPPHRGLAGRDRVLSELCEAALAGTPPIHDGRFGRGTVEVVLAIVGSSRQHRDIDLGEYGKFKR